MDWFLYHRDPRHGTVNGFITIYRIKSGENICSEVYVLRLLYYFR